MVPGECIFMTHTHAHGRRSRAVNVRPMSFPARRSCPRTPHAKRSLHCFGDVSLWRHNSPLQITINAEFFSG